MAKVELILQLSFHASVTLAAPPVACSGDRLVYAPPEGPFEEVVQDEASGASEAADEMADLAGAEVDQREGLLVPLFCRGAALSLTRMPARKARASMASVMCRYHPCHERIS